MLTRSAGILIQTTVLAVMLVGCERQDAADHRAAVDALRAATNALQSTAATGEDATRALTRISSDLRSIRGGSKIIDASRDRLICQTQVRLADLAWQSGLEDRGEAEAEAGTLASLSAAYKDHMQRLGLMEDALAKIDTDVLSMERMARATEASIRRQEEEKATSPVYERQAANAQSHAEALALRTQSSNLRTRARSVDALTGQPLLEEAARLDLIAASLEAAAEQRTAQIDLNHDMILQKATLRADLTDQEVQVVDEQLKQIDTIITAARDSIATEREVADRLAESLRTSTNALIESLTGPLKTHYDQTIDHLQQATKAASGAIRSAAQSDKEGDRISAIRVSIATMAIAGARQAELAGGLRLIGGASQQGGTVNESRQVLQDLWEEASKAYESANQSARSQATSLGGDLGATLLNAMGEATEASDAENGN
ncbi:MAG: hypothetical protein MK100_06490 [Phycisphaerales bacterium]|nr:hypothetical protein [Phycisphaerales bacterium]